jgi:hypothetical protein
MPRSDQVQRTQQGAETRTERLARQALEEALRQQAAAAAQPVIATQPVSSSWCSSCKISANDT